MLKLYHLYFILTLIWTFGYIEIKSDCTRDSYSAVCTNTSYSDTRTYIRNSLNWITGLKCISCGASEGEFLLDIDKQEHRWMYLHWINQPFNGKFDRLRFVMRLELDNNSYTLEPNTLEKTTRLIRFFFRHNGMETLPNELFKNTPELKEVVITHNGLKTLPKDLFKSCANLEIIDLSNNDLYVIPKHMFEYNNKLTHLNIESNRLTKLPAIQKIPLIRNFKFGNNPLVGIDARKILNIKTLRSINFDNLPCYIVREKILDYCFYAGHCSLQWRADMIIRYLMIRFDVDNPNAEKHIIASYYNYQNSSAINREMEWASDYYYGVRCIDYCGKTLPYHASDREPDRQYILDLIKMLENDFEETQQKHTLTIQAIAALESLQELKSAIKDAQYSLE